VTKIIDCTLREGNQSPGVSFTAPQSVEIAQALDRYGVDAIEIGHPFVGLYERARVEAVTALGLGVPLLGHARAKREDILAVSGCGCSWVGIFLGVNDISLKAKLSGRSFDKALMMVRDSVAYAVNLGLKVRFSVEDSSRTGMDRLAAAFAAALEQGAERICYGDTVGVLTPSRFRTDIRALRALFPSASIEVHAHNDRGMALATVMDNLEYIDWVSASVNGIGERCGITDTIALAENLAFEGRQMQRSLEESVALSRLVAALSRTSFNDRAPISGRHAFTHTCRLHRLAARQDSAAYNWRKDATRQQFYEHTINGSLDRFVNNAPKVVGASELKFHTDGHGRRFVMMNSSVVSDAGQYCIVREIPPVQGLVEDHVEAHRHHCDSLFLFLGNQPAYEGLEVEVQLETELFTLKSPAAVLIPSGRLHKYRILRGAGTYINHVLSGSYNESLI
jgi:2-isopropylmalate synthase